MEKRQPGSNLAPQRLELSNSNINSTHQCRVDLLVCPSLFPALKDTRIPHFGLWNLKLENCFNTLV
jgi:hypothetical protein